jgi:hypothetical protein
VILRLRYSLAELRAAVPPATDAVGSFEQEPAAHSDARPAFAFPGYRPVSDIVPQAVNDALGRLFGWHWMIEAQKDR